MLEYINTIQERLGKYKKAYLQSYADYLKIRGDV